MQHSICICPHFLHIFFILALMLSVHQHSFILPVCCDSRCHVHLYRDSALRITCCQPYECFYFKAIIDFILSWLMLSTNNTFTYSGPIMRLVQEQESVGCCQCYTTLKSASFSHYYVLILKQSVKEFYATIKINVLFFVLFFVLKSATCYVAYNVLQSFWPQLYFRVILAQRIFSPHVVLIKKKKKQGKQYRQLSALFLTLKTSHTQDVQPNLKKNYFTMHQSQFH